MFFPRFPVEFLRLFPTTQVFGAYFGLAAATVLGASCEGRQVLVVWRILEHNYPLTSYYDWGYLGYLGTNGYQGFDP